MCTYVQHVVVSSPFRLIHAFDKDPKRFKILKERVRQAGATCVSSVLHDFLQVHSVLHRYQQISGSVSIPTTDSSDEALYT